MQGTKDSYHNLTLFFLYLVEKNHYSKFSIYLSITKSIFMFGVVNFDLYISHFYCMNASQYFNTPPPTMEINLFSLFFSVIFTCITLKIIQYLTIKMIGNINAGKWRQSLWYFLLIYQRQQNNRYKIIRNQNAVIRKFILRSFLIIINHVSYLMVMDFKMCTIKEYIYIYLSILFLAYFIFF